MAQSALSSRPIKSFDSRLQLCETYKQLCTACLYIRTPRRSDEEMPLTVHGSVLQGSILGVLLFNISTDDLEDADHDDHELVNSTTTWTRILNVGMSPKALAGKGKKEGISSGVSTHRWGRGQHCTWNKQEEDWWTESPNSKKYVDEGIMISKVNMDSVTPALMPNNEQAKIKHDLQTQNLFRRVVKKAESVVFSIFSSFDGVRCLAACSFCLVFIWLVSAGTEIMFFCKMKTSPLSGDRNNIT